MKEELLASLLIYFYGAIWKFRFVSVIFHLIDTKKKGIYEKSRVAFNIAIHYLEVLLTPGKINDFHFFEASRLTLKK